METNLQLIHGDRGRHPRLYFSPEYLQHLLEMPLSVITIARLSGVSRHSVRRRLLENNKSVTSLHGKMSNEELDVLVADIKLTMPHCGSR